MRPAADLIESILASAVDIDSPAERRRFVERACGGDPELRRRVEELVENHFHAGSFLEQPAVGPAETAPPDTPAADTPTPPREPPAAPADVIGPYKLLEVVGEGGMGTVYLAEQQEPIRRLVALKVIKPGMDSKAVLARFEAERQALALMDHPNIARVLDAGATPSGRPYFVMELVKGVAITRYCDERRLTPRQRLELFVPVCQAVQHAHQKGVIHRDLKPSNVLVAPYDGRPVPKVIDFGVAKAIGQPLIEKTLFTGLVAVVGTPEYMSPEQAELNNRDIDTRSDVYSLGVLLYELLTGTTPLDRDRVKESALLEVLRLVREEEPPKPSTRVSTAAGLSAVAASRGLEPRRLCGLLRGEPDWIVMKALEKDRSRRYETAAAFAADVERYLADEPVQACPPSTWYRFGKFARRNRREVLIAGAAAAVAVTGVAGLAVSRAIIARALQSETKAKEDLRVEVYFQRITVAHRELSMGNLAAALRALDDCPADLRGWEWHYLMRLIKVEPLILQDSTEVYGVAFSPDGERIASAGKDRKIKIWDSRTGKLLLEIPGAHDKAACSVVFHPDGRHLAAAGADRLVKVWDLETRQEVFRGPCDAIRSFGAAYTVAFRPPDGRHLAAGCDQKVRVWDWKTDQLLHTVAGPEYHSIPVAFTGDGQYLATGGTWPQGLTVWDAETERLLRTLPAHRDRHPVSALAFSPDGGRLASASLGRSVSLWDMTTGELLRPLPHTGNVLGVAFSSDGQRLASVGEDKTVHLWDAATGREVLGLHGHTDMCGCVAFSPDGWRLASASHDRTIRVWDATPLQGNEGQGALTFTQHDHEVRSVAVSPDGRWIASAGNGTLVRVWDAATGRVSFNFPEHSAPVFAVAWHPDGRRIATAGSAGRQHAVKVWDASDGRMHFEVPVSRGAGPYQAVAFSPPDGRYLVTGQLEGAVQVWDARNGQQVQVLEARTGKKSDTFATHDREIRAVVFSRDGRLLASASGDGTVKLWDATRLGEKQEPRLTLPARVPGPSVNVAFSPDGRRLATGGEGNTVKIWDAEKGGEPPMTLRGHSREVYAVVFSPDGRWIASGGEDSKVKIWDSRSGELVLTFHGHTSLISSLAFSPDGKRLYSGSRDTTVKVWDLAKLDKVPDR
jgi:WD40 repeat protein/serine/threonine protein kinase